MKIAKLMFALSVITAASLSGAALAHGHKGHDFDSGRHAQHAPMKRLLAGLDLTDSQREQIKQLVQQHRSEFKRERPDRVGREQLQTLLLAEQFDDSAARQLLQQQQEQVIEKRLAVLKLQHQVLQLLTAEQRQQLAEKREKWQQKRLQRQSS